MASGIVTGPVTQSVAQDNRVAIETDLSVTLPGAVQLDQALDLKTSQRIEDGSLENAYKSDGYPLNCSVQCYGTGVGYADVISRALPNSVTKWKVEDPAALANFKVGQPAHFFLYDGYYNPSIGQLCARRNIISITGNVLTLSSAIDSRCNRAKWYATAAPIIQDVRAGQISVSVPTQLQAQQFAPGDWVMITAGADIANSDHFESHRVVAITNMSIQLDYPTQRSYKQAVIAKYGPIHNADLVNVDIESPVNSGANGAFLKYLVNSAIVGGRCNSFAMGSSSNIVIRDCEFTGETGLNSCNGVTFINCIFERLALEESCFDIAYVGCVFGPHPDPLVSSVGCERLTFISCVVMGGWVSLNAPNMLVEDFEIVNSTAMAMFQGNGLQVRRLRASAGVIFTGLKCCVQDVSSPSTCLGWIDGSNSTGNAIACENPVQVQGAWRVV